MQFLHDVPQMVFYTGKGGVGKTSLACATAVHLAEQGRRVLLVSTDPASNVGQVFGMRIGNAITAIPEVARLYAVELDPQMAAAQYRDRIVGPVRGILPDAVVASIEEQLSGACTTEIAAFDEFTALLTTPALLTEYDHIVFDTAPTGHTIRLLRLPGAWTHYLKAGRGEASCLGPLSGLQKQQAQYRAAVAALADGSRTRLVLVARAQRPSLLEVGRTRDELASVGLTRQHLVINAVLPESERHSGDRLAESIWRREQDALSQLPASLTVLPTDRITLKPYNLVGVPALRSLLSDAPFDAPAIASSMDPASSERGQLVTLVDSLVDDGHGLIMLMGKGGVGKTTLAAAIAVELAERGYPVHLTTSDPAAHVADTLAGSVPNLTLSQIDPAVETKRYCEHVLATKGKHLDAQGRAVLEEDLRSPCTEEIAVFQAFSRVIRESSTQFVVMDTAPTGHTLLLLDATGAYHRDIARQMDKTAQKFTTPLMRLQDPTRTKILIVTLPETTPVLEAASLQSELRRAQIEPWGWIINQSIANVQLSSDLLSQRSLNERVHLQTVASDNTTRLAVVPLLMNEPVGVSALKQLMHPSGT